MQNTLHNCMEALNNSLLKSLIQLYKFLIQETRNTHGPSTFRSFINALFQEFKSASPSATIETLQRLKQGKSAAVAAFLSVGKGARVLLVRFSISYKKKLRCVHPSIYKKATAHMPADLEVGAAGKHLS